MSKRACLSVAGSDGKFIKKSEFEALLAEFSSGLAEDAATAAAEASASRAATEKTITGRMELCLKKLSSSV